MVGTNASTNENHKFYNSTVQAISIGGGDCATNFGDLCACFFIWEPRLKSRCKMVSLRSFVSEGRPLMCLNEPFFTLKDLVIHYEEGNKTNVRKLLTAGQRQSGRFLLFMMTVHPYQSNPNCKHSRMNCRACVQLSLYVYGIDDSIDTQML